MKFLSFIVDKFSIFLRKGSIFFQFRFYIFQHTIVKYRINI